MNKAFVIFLSVCIALLGNPGLQNGFAAEAVYAAEVAEAQMIAPMQVGTTGGSDLLYPVVGSGFTGVGKDIKSIINLLRSSIQEATAPKRVLNDTQNIAPQTAKEAVVLPQPVIQEKTMTDEEIVPVIQETIAIQTEILQRLSQTQDAKTASSRTQDDIVIFLPLETQGTADLATMIEGEALGVPVAAISPTAYKVAGATIAVTGILFLILGLVSGGGGSGESVDGSEPGSGGGDGDYKGRDGGPHPGEGEDEEAPSDNNENHNPVPEPGTLFFLFSILPALWFRRRSTS